MAPDDPQQPSQPIGQYYLLEKIAQGGMAEIFKGLSYDVHGHKKEVCIKKVLPHLSASEEFIGSLIEEAKLAVKLVHGNIAQTYDLGKVGDDYFMVMEFVDGKSLSQINKKCMAKGKLIPIPSLVFFISEVLNGLSYMHRRTDEGGAPLHIVHRDISPQNLMVSYAGTVKIIDFGIAKAAINFSSTDTGMLKGKFAYMSPEQAHGDAIDHRSDIFSLGIILHEMLTGRRLFKAEDSRETIRNVRRAKVDPPSAIRKDLPEELDRIALKALAKDRRHRYALASEMHDDLVKFLHTHYPDFKSSEAAQFVQDLFRDERKGGRPHEVDSKTPHLIIDRSNSALADDSQFEVTGAARAPLNMGEYMLEDALAAPEETPPAAIPADDATGGGAISGLWPPPAEIAEEPSDHWGTRIARRLRRKHLVRRLATAGLVAIVLAAAIAFVGRLSKGPALPEVDRTFAQAMVVTQPTDALVSLDGTFIGQGSPVTVKNIPPGENHTIDIARDGYATQQRIVHLAPGEFASLQVTLATAGQPTATVELVSEPPGATVFIDDQETSYRTPAVIKGIEADKEITFGIFVNGYRFWSKKVTLRREENRTFEVRLDKDFGSLSVDSAPAKALVLLDGVPVGQTPFTKGDLEDDRVYRVEVWHEGYQPYAYEFKANAGRREEVRTTLVLEPKVPGTEAPKPSEPTAAAPTKAVPAGAPAKPEATAPKPEGAAKPEAPAKTPVDKPVPNLIESPAPIDTPRGKAAPR